MIYETILTRSEKERIKDTQKRLQDLNNFDIESIGTIDGTEFARKLKLFAERFSKSKYSHLDKPELICFISVLFRNMQKLKKEPEEKYGEWIEKQIPLEWCEDDVDIVFECSVCKEKSPFTSDYCPSCGAKMDRKDDIE